MSLLEADSAAVILPVRKTRTVTIGVLGCGTVGGGVVERLLSMSKLDGLPVRLGPILVRDLSSTHRPVGAAPHLTIDPSAILDDPRVDVVVECLGGIDPALSYVERALRSGKHVVTANKTLLATWGPHLFSLANRCGAALRFEGAVGGAIPVIRALHDSLAAEDLYEVAGIFNGTTNFVLCAMEGGLDFDAALNRARAEGYAEADPSNDVRGVDSAQKLALLIGAAFDVWVPWEAITHRGIDDVTSSDIAFAHRHRHALRLIACARRTAAGIAALVTPAFVPLEHDFARLRGVKNAVRVIGRTCGALTFSGPGAGRHPTASAVLGDLAEVVREAGRSPVRSNAAKRELLLRSARCQLLELPAVPGSTHPVWVDRNEDCA